MNIGVEWHEKIHISYPAPPVFSDTMSIGYHIVIPYGKFSESIYSFSMEHYPHNKPLTER